MNEHPEPEDNQSSQEQIDQYLLEFLQELRVVLPGVQVLLAFLLTVPFSQRFHDLTQLQQYVFFGSLLCTAATTVLLIAPSAHHRLLLYRGVREPSQHLLQTENKLAIVGLAFLGPAMSGVVFVIADLVFGSLVASIVTAGMVVSLVWLWFVLPLSYNSRS